MTKEKAKKMLERKIGFFNIYDGASVVKKTLKNWQPGSQTADQDILKDLNMLRTRSRSLYSNNPVAASAIDGSTDSVIGSGLKLNSQVNREILGLEESAAAELDRHIENEFKLWAENFYCDSERVLNFYALQDLAFTSTMLSGDFFTIMAYEANKPGDLPYRLSLKTIEADRVCNPANGIDTSKTAGGITVNRSGAPKVYHIRSYVPHDYNYLFSTKFDHVTRFGRLTKRLQVIHLFKKFRPGQRRGVPFLAPVIEKIKQMDRYELAEIDAAVVAALFTVFIKSESGNIGKGDEYGAVYDEGIPESEQKENEYYMGPGAVNGLAPGESIETADPKRPNSNFDPFIKSFTTQIGAALNIPMEVLLNHFESSYSASRAALLKAWNFYRNRRAWIVSNFITPVYAEWFTEAVLRGRINAPGFLTDYRIRQAYLTATWTGPGMGQIDPVKETKAAILRKRFNLSTGQHESSQLNGSDYEQNIKQNSREDTLEAEISPSMDDQDTGNVSDPNLQDEPKTQNKKRKKKKNTSQLSLFIDPEQTIRDIIKEPDQKTD